HCRSLLAGEHLDGNAAAVAAIGRRLVQREVRGALHVRVPAPEDVHVHSQSRGYLPVVGLAAQLMPECLTCRTQLAGLATHGARYMVLPTEFVQDRTAYPRRSKGTERQPALRL